MIMSFFDRRVEKRNLSEASTRFFKKVYRKLTKLVGSFIFYLISKPKN